MDKDNSPTDDERVAARNLGRDAKSSSDNPYWKEYPKSANGGLKEECLARAWVDGYTSNA